LQCHQECRDAKEHDERHKSFLESGDERFTLLEPYREIEHDGDFEEFGRLKRNRTDMQPASCGAIGVAQARNVEGNKEKERDDE
jgi:hypothetical protein